MSGNCVSVMDLFLIELLVSRCASIDVLQLETYGILVLGTKRTPLPLVLLPPARIRVCRALGCLLSVVLFDS